MKKEELVMFSRPPRLLLGVTFLFWGAMHDQSLPALAAAILVEGRHWTNLRWEFGEKGFVRAWQLAVLILIVSTIRLLQVGDLVESDFLSLVSWLPFMMLPLGLAQQYASDYGVPMTTFSFIARRKFAADRKAGRAVRIRNVNLGFPFFFLILMMAGMGVGNVLSLGDEELRYALGVVLLLGWGLFRVGERKGRRGAWGMAYGAAILTAVAMVWGLVTFYRSFMNDLTMRSDQLGNAFETQTSIGEVKELKQSSNIMWRYYHQEGAVPDLVRISSYNWPQGDQWLAGIRSKRGKQKDRIATEREIGGDFEKFLSVGENAFLFHEEDRELESFTTRGEIIGMVSNQDLIPHPLRTKRLEAVPTEFLSANSMGAIQLVGPKQRAMRMSLFVDERSRAVELDPSTMDLLCPAGEEEGLDQFLDELGLKATIQKYEQGRGRRVVELNGITPAEVSEGEFEQVVERIGQAFGANFEYTLFLRGADDRAPMSEFVNETREGHCEYFGGATALLLRRMGIPTRYVVGYAVSERGDEGDEFLLRGHHAHAWAQAYVGGSWVDESLQADDPIWRCRGGKWVTVDLTPASWLSDEGGTPWYQGAFDWFQKARADFVLWFAGGAMGRAFLMFFFLGVGGFVMFLIYKMFKMRGREGRGLPGSWEESVRRQGVLREFERWLARRVGPRPAAMPMGTWLRERLPEGAGSLVECYEVATFDERRLGVSDLEEEVRAAKELWKDAQKKPRDLRGREVLRR